MRASAGWIGIPLGLALCAIFTTPIAPMVDWGEHLLISHLLGQLDQWPPAFAQEYCKAPFFPYHTFHYLTSGLLLFVDPMWISRVMLTLLLLWFGLGVFLMVKAFRADIRCVGLAFPLFFGFIYQMGFGPNLLGLPFLFVSLAQAERWRLAPSKANGALLTCILLLAWLVHPMPFYVSMCCLAAFFFCHHWRTPLRLLQDAMWMLLPALISVAYILWIATYINPTLISYFPEPGLLEKLARSGDLLMGIERGQDIWVSWLFLACIALLVVDGWLASRDTETQSHIHLAALSVPAVLLGFYLLTPHFAMGTHYVFQRFLQPFVLVLLCFVPPCRTRRSRCLFVAGYGVALLALGLNWQSHAKWEKKLTAFHKITTKIPAQTRLVVLASPLDDRLLKQHVLTKLGHLLAIRRPIRVSPSLTHGANMPVHVCDPTIQNPLVFSGTEQMPWNFQPAKHHRFASHLLLYSNGNTAMDRYIYRWLYQPGNGGYKFVARAGRWLLLRSVLPSTGNLSRSVPRPTQKSNTNTPKK